MCPIANSRVFLYFVFRNFIIFVHNLRKLPALTQIARAKNICFETNASISYFASTRSLANIFLHAHTNESECAMCVFTLLSNVKLYCLLALCVLRPATSNKLRYMEHIGQMVMKSRNHFAQGHCETRIRNRVFTKYI